MTNEQFPVLYVLARTDLQSMNSGKLAAQTCHAGSAFAKHMENTEDPLYEKWQRETSQGFGTVLVVGVTESQMRTANIVAGKLGYVADIVTDPTYPILVDPELGRAIGRDYEPYKATGGPRVTPGANDRYVTISEDTCSYIFMNKLDPIGQSIVQNFKLHP